MKKIWFLLMIILLVGCSNEDIVIPSSNGATGTGNITFAVSIPEAANIGRAFTDEGAINSLQLLVFDKNGMLVESRIATLVDPTGGGNTGTYSVTLERTDQKRIIHFVANVENATSLGSTEHEIFTRLYTVGEEKDAYWYRMVLENGIQFSDQEENPQLEEVRLVRNYAKIEVANEASGFRYEGFYVINTINAGTVAAYKERAEGDFVDFGVSNRDAYQNYSYLELLGQQYNGIQPPLGNGVIIDDKAPTANDFYTDPKYIYERRQTGNATPVSILVKGQFNGQNTSFYKVDLVYKLDENETNSKNEYYNILRNFRYIVTIKSVAGNGYTDIKTAMEQPASNNFMSSIESRSFLNISDGKARMFVSTTDTTIVDTKQFNLKYKFFTNILNGSSRPENSSSRLKLSFPEGDVIENAQLMKDTPDTKGYSTLSITPKSDLIDNGQNCMQVLTLKDNESKVYREIIIRYRPKITTDEFNVSCTSQVSPIIGKEVIVYFTLPPYLVESIFPLTFVIEPSAHSITPVDVLPVVALKKSSDPNVKGGSYGFEKVVTWGDYKKETGITITCNFKTSIAKSSSNIYVSNKYFETNSTSFVAE